MISELGRKTVVLGRLGGLVPRDDKDPAVVREEIGQILQRREFRYEKSLIARLFEWLGKLLDRILPSYSPPVAVGGPGLGSMVIAVILIAAAIAVVAFAMVRLRRRSRRSKEDQDAASGTRVSVRANEPLSDWLDEALRLESGGDWKGSVLLRYRKLVDELVERGLVACVPGSTPGELRDELRDSMPSAENLFGEATRLFEDPWYGAEPTGQLQVERLETLSREILGGNDQQDGHRQGVGR